MRLKYAITIGDPKSPGIEYAGRSTGTSHLTKADILTALGMVQTHEPAGMALIYAKYTKDKSAAEKAASELEKFASGIRRQYQTEANSADMTAAIHLLAAFVLEDYCRTADTPGAKCRCGGRCEVLDIKTSQRAGYQVMKPCPRCKGTGLKPLTHTRVHHALIRFLPVSQPTYSRRWKPLYDAMLSWCYQQESAAERCYNDITGLRPAVKETGKKLQEVRQ